MTEPSGPEIMGMVLTMSRKMIGTTIDIEEAFEQAVEAGTVPFGYHQAPKMFFTFLDRKVWKCETCDHWCEPAELNANDICQGCQ